MSTTDSFDEDSPRSEVVALNNILWLSHQIREQLHVVTAVHFQLLHSLCVISRLLTLLLCCALLWLALRIFDQFHILPHGRPDL